VKVTFIIQDLFCQGAQRATALLCRGFIKKGYEVDLIVSAFHDALMTAGKSGCFTVPDKVHWIHLKDVRASRNILQLRWYLKTTDSVAVISMCSTYTEALAVASLGLWKCPKLYSVEHGITFALHEDWSEKKLPRFFTKAWWEWKLIKRLFNGFLAVSQRIADEYLRMYGVKAIVVYNPVEEPNLENTSQTDSTERRIITAGSFTTDKNHLYLIQAFEQAIMTHSSESWSTTLVIYGEGPLRKDYEAYIAEHHLEKWVKLPGYSTSILSEMKKSLGYICSSQIESFAIAPVEAMMCGVPVVCCDCPCGPREILENGKYGRLVPSGDINAMAVAIDELANGKIPVAPPEAYERFSVEAITERYIEAMGL